jgi:magnesium chelatase family protein
VPSEELLGDNAGGPAGITTAYAAARVRATRDLQCTRSGKLNADLTGSEIQRDCRLDRHCRLLLAQARAKLHLSARGIHRVLRVARTIADLEMKTGQMDGSIRPVHLAEALQLRRAVD